MSPLEFCRTYYKRNINTVSGSTFAQQISKLKIIIKVFF